jgi:hypothetical protein
MSFEATVELRDGLNAVLQNSTRMESSNVSIRSDPAARFQGPQHSRTGLAQIESSRSALPRPLARKHPMALYR